MSDVPYGLLARFSSAETLLDAARETHAAGFRHTDAYTPFPVDGLVEALGHGGVRRGVQRLAIGGFVAGAAGAFLLQYYTAVIAYPFDSGGRPLNSWPAFLILCFEAGVLVSALCTFIGSFVKNGLPRLHHPLFAVDGFEHGTRDRFLLCIEASDPLFDQARTRRFLESLDAGSVDEVAP